MNPQQWEKLAELLTRVVVVSAVSLGAAALIFEALR
jgi:hypothetical protein